MANFQKKKDQTFSVCMTELHPYNIVTLLLISQLQIHALKSMLNITALLRNAVYFETSSLTCLVAHLDTAYTQHL